MPKQSVKYRQLIQCEVGQPARVEALNHPNSRHVGPLNTSPVVSYDPISGVFETQNTRYLPAPFASWPDGEDCPVESRSSGPTRMAQMAALLHAKSMAPQQYALA